MGEWDEKLSDPESEEFKSYSETITRGIEEMLAQDENLSEQADFTVTIVGFRLVIGLLRDKMNCTIHFVGATSLPWQHGTR